MPPTESNLLTSFLLPPSPLPISLPLPKFTSLFPPSLHSSPSIQTLYADLHSQRTNAITLIRQNILSETTRGQTQIRQLRKARHRTTPITEKGTTEKRTTRNVQQGRDPHTLDTLTTSLSTATKTMESEIAILEAELAEMLQEMRLTVGDLSDLRYGRFTKTPGASTELREEVLEAVERVREGAVGVGEQRR